MNDKIVEQTRALIKRLLELLQKEYKILETQGYGIQAISDIPQKQIRTKNGTYAPLEKVEYGTIYDHYENAVFKAFIILIENIFTNIESPFISFSFRTAMDLGFFINVLFSKDITMQEKKHIKLVTLLTDLSPLNFPPYTEFFNKLLNSKLALLDTKEQSFFKEISDLHISFDPILTQKAIKARSLLSDKIETLRKKAAPLPVLQDTANINSLYSAMCHLLQGNPYFVKNALDKSRESNRIKAMLIILLFGLNSAERISQQINDDEIKTEVQKVYKTYKTIMPDLNKYCEEIFFKF